MELYCARPPSKAETGRYMRAAYIKKAQPVVVVVVIVVIVGSSK